MYKFMVKIYETLNFFIIKIYLPGTDQISVYYSVTFFIFMFLRSSCSYKRRNIWKHNFLTKMRKPVSFKIAWIYSMRALLLFCLNWLGKIKSYIVRYSHTRMIALGLYVWPQEINIGAFYVAVKTPKISICNQKYVICMFTLYVSS